MIALILIGAAAIYLGCGVLAYKGTFAYFQHEYPGIAEKHRRDDMGIALLLAVLGPVGFFIGAVLLGLFKHGFSTGPRKRGR